MKIRKVKVVGLLATVMAASFATGLGMLTEGVSAATTTGSYYLRPSAKVSILKDEATDRSAYFSMDFTAVVEEEFYTENLVDKDYVLGVVIAPDKGVAITLETSEVENVCYVGSSATMEGITAVPNFLNGDYTFTASIIYNSAELVEQYNAAVEPDLTKEEILQKVANLELVARPYYKIGENDPVYGETTVTRSVKNVLNEVELRGKEETGIEIPDGVLNEFVGTTTTLDDAQYFLNKNTGELLQFSNDVLKNVSKTELGNVDDYVLSGKRVDPTDSENVVFNIEDIPTVSGGELRGVSLITGDATKNIKATVITDVITNETELKAIRYLNNSVAEDVYGYFLLANDITLTANWDNAMGTSYLKNAFKGTLDGLGHKIVGAGFVLQNGGLFGRLDGATVKNLALIDVNSNKGATYKGVFASHVYNSLIENVYVSLSENFGGYTEWNGVNCGILSGTKTANSTFKNIIINVPQEYTEVGSSSNKKFGFMPVFGPSELANVDIENVYLIGEMPYTFSFKDGVVTMEFAPNITNGTSVAFGQEYDISTVLDGEDETLKKFAKIAQTVYPETLTYGNPAEYVPASKFVLTNTLTSGNSYGQYETLASMATAGVSNEFADSEYWATTSSGYVFWHTEENTFYKEAAQTFNGEFYIEEETGDLLFAKDGTLKPVAQAQLPTNVEKIFVDSALVTYDDSTNVSFNTENLATLSLGNKATIIVVGDEIKKLEATFITKAIKNASDFSAFNVATNDGYYVLANDIDFKDYTLTISDTNNFKGTFDGRGHKIINLTVGTGGLFGNIQGNSASAKAELKNFAVIDFKFNVEGSSRYMLGKVIKNTSIQNVYVSYAGGGSIHKKDSFGGILAYQANNNVFTNVIVENKQKATDDTIGLFGHSNHNNTFTDSYFISDSAQMILNAGGNVLQLIVGKNLNGDIEIAKEYTIADVLAEGSTYSESIKKIATIAQNIASNSLNGHYTKFKVTYPGGNSGYADHLIPQYLTADDMPEDGYSSFDNGYWTVESGEIPVWANLGE